MFHLWFVVLSLYIISDWLENDSETMTDGIPQNLVLQVDFQILYMILIISQINFKIHVETITAFTHHPCSLPI